MKGIFSIILFIISFGLNAQTDLDSLLFDKVNEYRESNGLNSLAWDSNVYKMANHHSVYLKILNQDSTKSIITHLEDVDVEEFEEMLYPNDRFKKYVNNKFDFRGENVGGVLKNRKTSNEKLVDLIFESWKTSSEHNQLMLNPKTKFGACSVEVLMKKFYITYKGKRILAPMKKCFATLNFHY